MPSTGTDFAARCADEMGLSDSALSKHLKALAARGYTRLDRAVRDGRQVTTVVLTPAGREALCGHVASCSGWRGSSAATAAVARPSRCTATYPPDVVHGCSAL